jgi:hypothetical protein
MKSKGMISHLIREALDRAFVDHVVELVKARPENFAEQLKAAVEGYEHTDAAMRDFLADTIRKKA